MKSFYFLFFGFMFFPSLSFSETLERVIKRGELKCGVSQGLVGFSSINSSGEWKGLDVDICRAISFVIFGKESVRYIPLSAQQRFTALHSGEIDILSRNTTLTYSRDVKLGLSFGPIVYYDGQGVMVRKADDIKGMGDLDGATICMLQGTTTELNISNYFKSKKIKFKSVVFENVDEVFNAFVKKRCDALSADVSSLASQKMKIKNSNAYVILDELISKEPLSPVVRQGDSEWSDTVRWTIYALIMAEELGVDSKNIKSEISNSDDNIKKFLLTSSLAKREGWVKSLILNIGNYEEIYDRNIGRSSPLNLPRRLNSLQRDGGLLYSPPFH